MNRNKEYRVFMLSIVSVALINIIGAFILDVTAGFLALGANLLLGAVIWNFNRKRYKKLEALSSYLHRICSRSEERRVGKEC